MEHEAREERERDERLELKRRRLHGLARPSCTGRRSRTGRTAPGRSRPAAPGPARPLCASESRFSSRPRSTSTPLTAPRASSSQPPATARSGAVGGLQPVGHRRDARPARRRACTSGRARSSFTPTMVVPHAAATRRTGVRARERVARRAAAAAAVIWKLDFLPRLGHLAHEAAVTELAGGELGAHAPQEVDELRALQASLDVELTELEDVRAPVQGLRLDDPAPASAGASPPAATARRRARRGGGRARGSRRRRGGRAALRRRPSRRLRAGASARCGQSRPARRSRRAARRRAPHRRRVADASPAVRHRGVARASVRQARLPIATECTRVPRRWCALQLGCPEELAAADVAGEAGAFADAADTYSLGVGAQRAVARRVGEESLEERRGVARALEEVGVEHAEVELGARVVRVRREHLLEQRLAPPRASAGAARPPPRAALRRGPPAPRRRPATP